ncbi:MAG: 4Fe-4S binding protein [Geminicoccaceae bacterium]
MPSVPTVDMDGCVRGMSPLASCRACVDSCPQGAWTLLDRGPALDAGRCDGCGHCQAACPQQAIGLAAQPQLREDRRGIFAVAICEPAAAAADGAWTLPCLHMLGWRQLVGLRRQGVDRLYACRLACDGCPRAATTRLDEHLAVAKRWWAAGADPGLEVVFLSRQGFADRLRSSEPAHPRGTSRRRLLTRWLAPDEPPARQGLLEVFVPEIDPASCSGCDARAPVPDRRPRHPRAWGGARLRGRRVALHRLQSMRRCLRGRGGQRAPVGGRETGGDRLAGTLLPIVQGGVSSTRGVAGRRRALCHLPAEGVRSKRPVVLA